MRNGAPNNPATAAPTQPAPSRPAGALAGLTGQSVTTLTRALPALRQFMAVDITDAVVPGEVPGSTPCIACRHCMAGKDIHGLVIQRAANHERVCLRHLRWLQGPEQHPLHALPEVCVANRHHRRLLRRRDTVTLDAALTRAQQLIHDRLQTGEQSDLRRRWRHQLDSLRHDHYADPYRPSRHRIELATYPEAVILTALLASEHWRSHPRLHDEAERRLGRVTPDRCRSWDRSTRWTRG